MGSPLSRLSGRCAHLDAANPLRALTDVINAVPGGINLGQGVCDLDAPRPLREGAVSSITASIEAGGDRQTYTHYAGLPELRRLIARKLSEFNGLDYGEDEIVVTPGSSGAFFAAGLCLLDPGDEVILFEPFYSYHHTALRLLEARPVCVPLAGSDLALDLPALRGALSPRTRAIVVNTPANPSGKVFTAEELRAIAEVIDGTDVVVLTDEVYEYMCFDGRRHVSPAAVDGLRDRCLTISSFSKTYSITGWRVGYLAGPAETADAVGRVCDQVHVCPSRPMQRGVERALRELPPSFYQELQASYQHKRDRFCGALERAGFSVRRPEGAYYALADYRAVLGDVAPYDAVLRLIERARINGVPGDLFHAEPDGVRTIRFHFAVQDDVLAEACRRIEQLPAQARSSRA